MRDSETVRKETSGQDKLRGRVSRELIEKFSAEKHFIPFSYFTNPSEVIIH